MKTAKQSLRGNIPSKAEAISERDCGACPQATRLLRAATRRSQRRRFCEAFYVVNGAGRLPCRTSESEIKLPPKIIRNAPKRFMTPGISFQKTSP